ncbi:Chloroperoxidase [Podospora appendiculata]|uniref:Chloroperoxidase n=1 Tax=Podospora appendiculata TaxID=314037 RepID=A0AAE0X4H8_9PEZI|nr:Chloroperoxidase [Podospora appendiculata]
MKHSLLVGTWLFSLAAALPEPKGHEWHPPGRDDSRSPCPGLNAMANHGWLPRSGKNIDLAALRYGVSHAYNYAPTVFDGAFQAAVDFNLTTTGNRSTINLYDLHQHNEIEFDGSLSRNDAFFGNDNDFDFRIWGPVADDLHLYDTDGPGKLDKYVTVELAAKARAARIKDASTVNPDFKYTEVGSIGTTALYLTTLWDDKVGAAQKEFVRAFFENDRIPYLEGYAPPQKQKTADLLNSINEKVKAVKV